MLWNVMIHVGMLGDFNAICWQDQACAQPQDVPSSSSCLVQGTNWSHECLMMARPSSPWTGLLLTEIAHHVCVCFFFAVVQEPPMVGTQKTLHDKLAPGLARVDGYSIDESVKELFSMYNHYIPQVAGWDCCRYIKCSFDLWNWPRIT